MSTADDDPLGFSRISLADLDHLDPADGMHSPSGSWGSPLAASWRSTTTPSSRLAGLSQQSVMGEHYYSTTAQCMNNFMVAQRFEDEERLDVTIDYVLTLRMRPTPVRLRLLKGSDSSLDYILIQRL